MSFEAISLFNDLVNNVINILFGYVGLLSAFLIMSYFAADKLNNWLAAWVLILFSLCCLMIVVQFNFIKTDMEHLYRHIIELKMAGDPALDWFGNNPIWAIEAQTMVQNFVTIGGYLGCIAFFIYQKKIASKRST